MKKRYVFGSIEATFLMCMLAVLPAITSHPSSIQDEIDNFSDSNSNNLSILDSYFQITADTDDFISSFMFKTNLPPVANFTYNPSSPVELDIVQFNDTSTDVDGTITSWSWDFDDGNTSTLQNPNHTFADDRTYSVKLTVTDNNCANDSKSKDVIVKKHPLVADAGGPYYGYTKTDIWFTGSAIGGERPYHFSWDFDNNGAYDDAYGEKVYHSYDFPGVYYISLEVRDNQFPWDYSINTTQVNVRMNNSPPITPDRPSGPVKGKINEFYRYESSTTDPEGDQIYYMWDWADGTTLTWIGPYASGQTVEASHSWVNKETYGVKVKAKDASGAESSWSDPLPITMPYSYKPRYQLFEWLFHWFSNAFLLLRQLIE